jgi:hypothetical protein
MVIGEMKKISKEIMRISVKEFKGYLFCDVRAYYKDPNGKWKPTPNRYAHKSGSFLEVFFLRTPRAQEVTTFMKKMDWKNGKGNYGLESSCYNVPPL